MPQSRWAIHDLKSFEKYTKYSLEGLSSSLLLLKKQILCGCHGLLTAAKSSGKEAEMGINTVGKEVVPLEGKSVNVNTWKRRWPQPSANLAEKARMMHYLYIISCTRRSKFTPPDAEEVIANDLQSHGTHLVFTTALPFPDPGTAIPSPGCTINAFNTARKSEGPVLLLRPLALLRRR
jgi:hypothetical protein